MKRTVSMILALLLTVSCFLVLPLSAEEVTGSPEQLLAYSNDYAKLYTDLELTKATDATTLEGLGIKPFAVDNLSYARLTENGLEMTSVNQEARGFVFNGCDLTGQSSYLIQMTMSFDEIAKNCYPFFGYGFKADATDWDVFKDGRTNSSNIRFNGTEKIDSNSDDEQSVVIINGFNGPESADRAVLWTALYTDHKEATYQFVVTDGKLAKILIKCDGSLYTFTATKDISAASGDFIISLRTDGSSTTKITLKSLAVLDADQLLSEVEDVTGTSGALPAYSNDYAKLYTDLGLTKATDATTLEDLGIKLFAVDTKSYAKLTGNGLEMTSVNKKARGFVFNGCDLTGQSSYLIQMTMSFDEITKDCYPFFGYGFNANATDWNVFQNEANRNNIRFNGGSKLIINGFSSNDDMAVLWTALYTDHKEATYQFVVTDGKLAKILIKCDGSLYTFTATKDMSAASGDFIISLRTDGSSTTKITLKSIAVLNADKLLSENQTAPAPVDKVATVGYQISSVDAGSKTYKARFVAALDSLNYRSAGFEISYSYEKDGSTVTYTYAQADTACTTAYTGILGNGLIRAKDVGGEYLIAMTVEDIPVSIAEITFTVRSYAVDTDGNQIWESGEAKTFIMTASNAEA